MEMIFTSEEEYAKELPYYIRLLYEYTMLSFYKENNNKNIWNEYDLNSFINRIIDYLKVNKLETFLARDYILYLMIHKYKILNKQQITIYVNESHKINNIKENDINSIRRKYYYEKVKYKNEKYAKENTDN